MKTTQVLAAAAALFPLAVVASNHESHGVTTTVLPTSVDTSSPTSSVDTVVPTATTGGTSVWKDLGCFKVSPDKVHDNLLAPNASSAGYVGSEPFNARGVCAVDKCGPGNYKYAATMGDKCFCADELDETLVQTTEDGVCNLPCPGYSIDFCGGSTGGYGATYAITVYENVQVGAGGGENEYPHDAETTKTHVAPGTTLTYAPTSVTTSGSTNATSSTTGSASQTTKTNTPVEAGAGSLAGHSATFLMAVCGVGALFFL